MAALLDAGCRVGDCGDCETPLHSAARRGDATVAAALLAAQADPSARAKVLNHSQWMTPLHMACWMYREEWTSEDQYNDEPDRADPAGVVRALLGAGAATEARIEDAWEEGDWTPAAGAGDAGGGRARTVGRRRGRGMTALHLAVEAELVGAVRALIDAGADVDAVADRDCSYEYRDCRTEMDVTPIDLAVELKPRMTFCLLAFRRDPVQQTQTPCTHARARARSHARARAHTHTRTHARTRTCTHTCTHARARARAHTHAHTARSAKFVRSF